jgi:hypothetical protein
MGLSGELALWLRSRNARDLNIVFGLWLVVSAFSWPHGADEQMTTCIVGALIALSGAAAMVADELRYVEAMVAALLIVSAVVVPHRSPLTPWNNVLVGAAIILLSLARPGAGHRLLHRLAPR